MQERPHTEHKDRVHSLYRRFYALLRTHCETKEEMVERISGGRTSKLSELEIAELEKLVNALDKNDAQWQRKNRMRRVLIAIAYQMGEDASFAKAWCEKYGVFGKKKPFNDYDARELKGLIEKFEKVKHHRIAAVDKIRRGAV